MDWIAWALNKRIGDLCKMPLPSFTIWNGNYLWKDGVARCANNHPGAKQQVLICDAMNLTANCNYLDPQVPSKPLVAQGMGRDRIIWKYGMKAKPWLKECSDLATAIEAVNQLFLYPTASEDME